MLLTLLLLAAAPAPVVRRIPAPEAHQGVATDGTHVYAIANSMIGKYDKRTGRRVAQWRGDPKFFPHTNSCAVVGAELVCAASNYPAVPMASSVEVFDTATMRHKRTTSLGPGRGSLTWLDWHAGSWWAAYANYDGRGGEPGRNHRYTQLVRLDADMREREAWRFPDTILARFTPMSSSGGAWRADGTLTITGHDHPELYVLRVPTAGSTLEHVGTILIATPGQAIDWDPDEPDLLWSIDRGAKMLVVSRVKFSGNDRKDPSASRRRRPTSSGAKLWPEADGPLYGCNKRKADTRILKAHSRSANRQVRSVGCISPSR